MGQPPMGRSMNDAGEFARDVEQGRGETERLDLGVQLVIDLIEGCDHAGITQVGPEGFETVAATSETVRRCEQLQYDLNEGPCVDTLRSQESAFSNALASDRRWPRWGPAVAERHGVGSLLSLLLYTHGESYGVLSLYSDRTNGYSSDDVIIAVNLAAHLAVAVAGGRDTDTRDVAIITRTVIGQAEGILMERHQASAERAFQMLREASQHANRKLSLIAADLVRTGEWPQPHRHAKRTDTESP